MTLAPEELRKAHMTIGEMHLEVGSDGALGKAVYPGSCALPTVPQLPLGYGVTKHGCQDIPFSSSQFGLTKGYSSMLFRTPTLGSCLAGPPIPRSQECENWDPADNWIRVTKQSHVPTNTGMGDVAED